MTTALETNGTALTAAESTQLNQLAARVAVALRDHVASGLEIGKMLDDGHKILAHRGSGSWTTWAVKQCGMSKATAINYRNAYLKLGLSVNDQSVLLISKGAMYQLTTSTAPIAAAKEAIEEANAGRRVTKKRAEELLAKHGKVSRKRKLAPEESTIVAVPPSAGETEPKKPVYGMTAEAFAPLVANGSPSKGPNDPFFASWYATFGTLRRLTTNLDAHKPNQSRYSTAVSLLNSVFREVEAWEQL